MAVDSFNTRTGNVTLESADVTTALSFIPENAANKKAAGTLGISTMLFPAEVIVKDYVDANTYTGVFSNNLFTQI